MFFQSMKVTPQAVFTEIAKPPSKKSRDVFQSPLSLFNDESPRRDLFALLSNYD